MVYNMQQNILRYIIYVLKSKCNMSLKENHNFMQKTTKTHHYTTLKHPFYIYFCISHSYHVLGYKFYNGYW